MIDVTGQKVKSIIRYDRSAKAWQVINGKTQAFPSGDEGKRQALLAALAADHPRLAGLVGDIAGQHDHNPRIVDRLIKAAQLVIRGHVRTDHVLSQTHEGVAYQVTKSFTAWFCTCDDPGIDSDYGTVCKHRLAKILDYLAGEQDQADFTAAAQRKEERLHERAAQRAAALPASVDRQSMDDFLG